MGVMTAKPGVQEARAAAIRWIEDILAQKDWLPTHLADAAGLAPSTILRLLNNPNHGYLPSFATISAISGGANVNIPVELMNAYGITRISQKVGQPISPPRIVIANDEDAAPRRSALPHARRDVTEMIPVKPVNMLPPELHEHSFGNHKAVPCPERLRGDKSAFAFYMMDANLGPWFPSQAIGYASTQEHAVGGDKVVIFYKDGRAVCRLLLEMNEDGYLLGDANGKEVTVPYGDLGDVAKVVMIEF